MNQYNKFDESEYNKFRKFVNKKKSIHDTMSNLKVLLASC